LSACRARQRSGGAAAPAGPAAPLSAHSQLTTVLPETAPGRLSGRAACLARLRVVFLASALAAAAAAASDLAIEHRRVAFGRPGALGQRRWRQVAREHESRQRARRARHPLEVSVNRAAFPPRLCCRLLCIVQRRLSDDAERALRVLLTWFVCSLAQCRQPSGGSAAHRGPRGPFLSHERRRARCWRCRWCVNDAIADWRRAAGFERQQRRDGLCVVGCHQRWREPRPGRRCIRISVRVRWRRLVAAPASAVVLD
jgi:hypothetical protein